MALQYNLHGSEIETFAACALQSLKQQNSEQLIEIIKQLHISNDLQGVKHQKFAEYCLKTILVTLGNELNVTAFSCLIWNILNIICLSPIVRRNVWKDQKIIQALSKSLKHSLSLSNKKLQKVCTNFLSSMLVGAPTSFYQFVGEEEIITLLLQIITHENYSEETFKSVICCFGLLCDGTDVCKAQLIELDVANAILEMGEKHALEDEDFSHLAAMTYDDLKNLKVNGSIGRQKFLKTQIDDVMYCSNSQCLRIQRNQKFKKCSRCKMAFYCSKECQVQHWKCSHFEYCTKSP